MVVRRYIYIFPHNLLLNYPYILLLYLFFLAAASLLFVHFLKMFFILVPVLFVIYAIKKVYNCYCTGHGWYACKVWPNDMCVI